MVPFVHPCAGCVAAPVHPCTVHSPLESLSPSSPAPSLSSPALHAALTLLLSPRPFFAFFTFPAAGSPCFRGRSVPLNWRSSSSLVVCLAAPRSPFPPCLLSSTASFSLFFSAFLFPLFSSLSVSLAFAFVIPAIILAFTLSSPSSLSLYVTLRSSGAILGRPLAFPDGTPFHSLLLTSPFRSVIPSPSSHLCCTSFLASHMSLPAFARTFAVASTSLTSPSPTLPLTPFGTNPIHPHHCCHAPPVMVAPCLVKYSMSSSLASPCFCALPHIVLTFCTAATLTASVCLHSPNMCCMVSCSPDPHVHLPPSMCTSYMYWYAFPSCTLSPSCFMVGIESDIALTLNLVLTPLPFITLCRITSSLASSISDSCLMCALPSLIVVLTSSLFARFISSAMSPSHTLPALVMCTLSSPHSGSW